MKRIFCVILLAALFLCSCARFDPAENLSSDSAENRSSEPSDVSLRSSGATADAEVPDSPEQRTDLPQASEQTTATDVPQPAPKQPTDPVTGRPLLFDDGEKPCPVLVFDHVRNILYVMDAARSDWDDSAAILWSWDFRKATGGRYLGSFSTCVDHKLRYDETNDRYVIATGGHGYVCLLEYPSGRILWDYAAAGANIHSMEYLPDGNIAVANSGGSSAGDSGWLRVYAASQGNDKGLYYVQKDLPGCHGVLWDPENRSLWAICTPALVEYLVGGSVAEPTLTEVARYPLPSAGGHDLAAVYGDTDLLWCTSGSSWIFSKTKGKFYADYAGSSFAGKNSGIKGIGNAPDSSKLLWIYPNGTQNAYHSDRIYVCEWLSTATGDLRMKQSTCKSSTMAFYKLRVFCSDYQ